MPVRKSTTATSDGNVKPKATPRGAGEGNRRTSKRITRADQERAQRYEKAVPKQFGDLWEKMQYLIECARCCELYKLDNDTWQAIYDLETEVSMIEPPNPPFGKRLVQA